MNTDFYLLSKQHTPQLHFESDRVKAISHGILLLGTYQPSLLHISDSSPDDRYISRVTRYDEFGVVLTHD